MIKEGREGGDSLTPRIETQVPLKPCPFCGGAARLREWPPHRKFKWGVDCLSCGAENKDFVGAPEAIAAWNARDSAPVGEASANPDLVEGIARAMRMATQGAAYQDDDDQIVLALGSFGAPVFIGARAECDAYLDELRARAALDYISSLGMVVVPREPTEAMLKAGEIPTRPISLENGTAATGLGLGADPSTLWSRMIEAAPKHTALSPREERAVTDGGLREALLKIAKYPGHHADDAAWQRVEWAREALSKDRGEAPNNNPKGKG